MTYIIFKNGHPVNSYQSIPYDILGIDPDASVSAEDLAALDCYTFLDSDCPSFDINLYYQVENWQIQGTTCIRTWTLGNQDSNDAWAYIKTQRNEKLSACDWTLASDSPLNAEKKQEWINYRKALRDVPQQYQQPQDVVWPIPPS